MKKQEPKNKTIYATFDITLNVNKNIGNMTLEDGLSAARAMKEHEVVDLDGLEFNDGTIKVTGLFEG
jgi:hypothetical protein